jgi:2'-5' RNA ligase
MRLFIAFPLEASVKDELAKILADFKPKSDAVKWVERNNLHLTSRFLGETHQDEVPKIEERLDGIAAKYEPFDSVMTRIGGFPNLRRPRVIWVGMEKNVDFMTKIATHVELAMQDIGFEAETKRFQAHLTLGRVKDPRRLEELTGYLQDYRFDPIPIRFDRLVLFKSTLTRTGPIYDRLHEAVLGVKS